MTDVGGAGKCECEMVFDWLRRMDITLGECRSCALTRPSSHQPTYCAIAIIFAIYARAMNSDIFIGNRLRKRDRVPYNSRKKNEISFIVSPIPFYGMLRFVLLSGSFFCSNSPTAHRRQATKKQLVYCIVWPLYYTLNSITYPLASFLCVSGRVFVVVPLDWIQYLFPWIHGRSMFVPSFLYALICDHNSPPHMKWILMEKSVNNLYNYPLLNPHAHIKCVCACVRACWCECCIPSNHGHHTVQRTPFALAKWMVIYSFIRIVAVSPHLPISPARYSQRLHAFSYSMGGSAYHCTLCIRRSAKT